MLYIKYHETTEYLPLQVIQCFASFQGKNKSKRRKKTPNLLMFKNEAISLAKNSKREAGISLRKRNPKKPGNAIFFCFARTSILPENGEGKKKNDIMQLHLYFTQVNLKTSRRYNTARTIQNSRSMLFLLKIPMLCRTSWFQHIAYKLPGLPAPLIDCPLLCGLSEDSPPRAPCSLPTNLPGLGCVFCPRNPPKVLQQDYFWSFTEKHHYISPVLNMWGLSFFPIKNKQNQHPWTTILELQLEYQDITPYSSTLTGTSFFNESPRLLLNHNHNI